MDSAAADTRVADPSAGRKRSHNIEIEKPEDAVSQSKRPCLSVSALASSSSKGHVVHCSTLTPSPDMALRVRRYITTNELLVSLRIASMVAEPTASDEDEDGSNSHSRRFIAICNAVFADSVRSTSYLDVNVVDHEGVPLAFRIVSAIFGPLNETDRPRPIDKELCDHSHLAELQRDTVYRDTFVAALDKAERNRAQSVDYARVLLRTFDGRLLDGCGRNILNWMADCCSEVYEILDSDDDPILDEWHEGGWLEHLITHKQLDVNRRVRNCNEPCLLQLAEQGVPDRVLIFLIQNGACVHVRTARGDSLLHLLAIDHDYQTLEALFLAFDIRMFEFDASNADSKTPLDLAKIRPASVFVEPTRAHNVWLEERWLRTIQVLSIECLCKE